ncbi:MAG: hypothetical protein K0Q94_372 [Paenibacillus sp.]|nr:hypothetical protein [Paenibacillus sp.]
MLKVYGVDDADLEAALELCGGELLAGEDYDFLIRNTKMRT